MDYSNYLTPEQMRQVAETQDPEEQVKALLGMQEMANRMHSNGIPLRENGRVVGPTSGWEVAGNAARDAAGAYMQRNLMNQQQDILKQNAKSRGDYAALIAEALRRNGSTPYIDEPITGSEFNMYSGY